jgi:chemotaxis protein MotB
MVSYADFITLMFAFFVVMFASSQADKGKAQQVAAAVRAALEGKPPPYPATGAPKPTELDMLTTEFAEEIRNGQIQISNSSRGLIISFAQTALFPSGEDVITGEADAGLSKLAAAINRVKNPVRLEGHTDAVPIHTARFQSNWDLSAARGIALLKVLVDRFGVSPARLSVAGYADTAPVASNETEEGRARNRRVDIVVLNDQGMQGEPVKVDGTAP